MSNGYEIKISMPRISLGKLQPIETDSPYLDELSKEERFVLAYNVAREIRRMEALAVEELGRPVKDEERIQIILPLLVKDSILADAFCKQLFSLIDKQNQMGERLDGRHLPQ